MKYNVHIYAVARVRLDGIEAESQAEAITKATQGFCLADHMRGEADDAEEIVSYLVDEEGDDEYENSRPYDIAPSAPTPVATRTELTEAGEQLLIPGCERVPTETAPKQINLWD